MKKGEISLLIIFISIIFLTGFISADTCDIRTRATCNTAPMNNIVMGLSVATNAHGEVSTTGIYPYVLCCDFTGSSICSTIPPYNKIIGLSAATNAHAEIPTGTNYANNVCYGSLDCIPTSTSCPTDRPISMLSLSSSTNAHLGAFADYSNKICCKTGSAVVGTSCTLTDVAWEFPETQNINTGIDVKMIVTGTNCAQGTTGAAIDFNVYKKAGDILVTATPMPINGNYNSAIWHTSMMDDAALSEKYYFIATPHQNTAGFKSSKDISLLTVVHAPPNSCIGKNLCSDYTTQSECNTDCGHVQTLRVNGNCPAGSTCCGWSNGVCSPVTPYTDIPVCNNKRLETGEACDKNLDNGAIDFGVTLSGAPRTCETERGTGYTGSLTCSADCNSIGTTGCTPPDSGACDGAKINAGEYCDGTLFGDKTCRDYDSFTGGNLQCLDGCTRIGTGDCTPQPCSDTRTAAEVCGTKTCGTADDTCGNQRTCSPGCTSPLVCNAAGHCASESTATCNGVALETGEMCDGTNFGTKTCASEKGPGYTGNLACTNNCQGIDISGCIAPVAGSCNNGVINLGEVCDGTNFGVKNCVDYDSYTGGSLQCLDNCKTIGTAQCSPQSGGALQTCSNGYTLCLEHVSDLNYCYPGNTCPAGNHTVIDGDHVCDPGDGCSSSDCVNGNQDNCVTGTTCQSGKCSNGQAVVSVSSCNEGSSLCLEPISGLKYCYPGTCPVLPVDNTPGLCSPGDSCQSADCLLGGPTRTDSCLSGSYCNSQRCFSPISTTGTCVYHETTTDDCADGQLTYSWDVTWTGPGTQPADCVGGSKVIPCAAQIQLPFFGSYQIAGAIIIIAGIYLIIILLKNNKTKISGKKRKR